MSLAKALRGLEELAREAGAQALAEEAQELGRRLAQGHFHVVVLGQFKRGKSTLLNALLGEPLLPVGIVPVTAIPTIIRFGEPKARVRLRSGEWTGVPPERLAEYITEAGNSGNRKGVRAVEVLAPHPLLAQGLCLVDTPGLGSTFEANTLATLAFVPQIDAAVVVLGTDPPITGEELRLVTEVAKQVPSLLFVINKWDRLEPDEAAEVREFTADVLGQRLSRPPGVLHGISALHALRGQGDAGEWNAFVQALHGLADDGAQLAQSAGRKGVKRLARALGRLLELERAGLVEPLERLEERLTTLHDLAASANRALTDLQPLLLAEEQRLLAGFEERRERFLRDSLPAAERQLSTALYQVWKRGLRIDRTEALELADSVAKERLLPWLGQSELEAEAGYRSAAERFAVQADHLVVRLGETAEGAGLETAETLDSSGFDAAGHFSFTHLMARHYKPAPLAWLSEQILPTRKLRSRIELATRRYLTDLLFVNASRVEGALAERLRTSRQQLEVKLRERLTQTRRATEVVIERVRVTRIAGTAQIAARVSAIDAATTELLELAAEAG